MTEDQVREMYPLGSMVRVNDVGLSQYHGQFYAYRGPGTVIGYGYNNLHVSFGNEWSEAMGHFMGHDVEEYTDCPGQCWILNTDQVERVMVKPIVSVPTGLPSLEETIPAEIPRLRVTIDRNPSTYNLWTLRIENGPQISTHELKQYMDVHEARRLGPIWRTQDITEIIHRGIDTYGINPQTFIDAATQASLAKQAINATGTFTRAAYDSELQKAIGSGPAMIAIGDQLFTLQPKGVIKTGRAMAMIRERIVKAARDNATKIKNQAQLEARGIIANGERQLGRAREKIEAERRALSMTMIIPGWIGERELPVRRWGGDNLPLTVGMEINTRINCFQMTHVKVEIKAAKQFHTVEIIRWTNRVDRENKKIYSPILGLSHYHTITVWIPFNPGDGRFSYKDAHIRDNNYEFPHLTTERTCMDLQGMPETLLNYNDYLKIQSIIQRGSYEVNMASLLCSFNFWHPDIQAQCPEDLKKLIDQGNYTDAVGLDDSYFINAERTNAVKDGKQTFSLENIQRERTAAGVSQSDFDIEAIAEGMAENEEETD